MRSTLTHSIKTAALIILLTSCNSQSASDHQTDSEYTTSANVQTGERVGGPCETCELIYVDMPENINATDTSAAWQGANQKVALSGTIYKPDGKTPAPNIILYYWQTNEKGIYADKEALDPRAKRHGYIRGWVKSDQNGQYNIYTNRPGTYPSRNSPAHIHLLIKEPDIKYEYYIDQILFDDDPLLTNQMRNDRENRGGSGIVKVNAKNGVQKVRRDIILGQNVPDYPDQQ